MNLIYWQSCACRNRRPPLLQLEWNGGTGRVRVRLMGEVQQVLTQLMKKLLWAGYGFRLWQYRL